MAADRTHEVKIDIKKTDSVKWTLKLDSTSNKVSSELSYVDDFEGWFARAPEIGSAHPDIPQLPLIALVAERMDGGLVKVDLSYESNNPEANYPGRKPGKIKTYGLTISSGEEHVLKHPKFAALDETSREALQNFMNSSKGNADYSSAKTAIGADPFGLYVLDKLRSGIESWVTPGSVWTERFTTGDLDDVEINKVGKIYDVSSPAPDLGGERSWLYMGANANMTPDGKFWEVERSFQASLPTGWDEDLYGEEAP